MRKVFTTGQAALVLGVSTQAVARWFDRGKLRGYKYPGRKDRRIPLFNLTEFMIDNGMAVDHTDAFSRISKHFPPETTTTTEETGR